MTDGVTTTVPSQTKEASEPVPENDSSDTEMHCGGDYESEIELPEGDTSAMPDETEIVTTEKKPESTPAVTAPPQTTQTDAETNLPETTETNPEEGHKPPETEGTIEEPIVIPEPEGDLIYDDLNYRVGFRTTPDGKSRYMVINDGDHEIIVPCEGNNVHILAFAYRDQGGAMLVSVLQEYFYESEQNGEDVTVYQMSVASYYGLQYYPDNGWSSARTGVYPDNKDMTDSAAAVNGDKMHMTVDSGDHALYNAREGTSFIILVDYDSTRPDSENRLIVSSDVAPSVFDWHIGREIGAIVFSPSYSSAN